MKAALARYAERIDAATLRERVLIFAAATLLLVALFNALFIEPLLDTEKRLSSEQAQRHAESQTIQEQLQKMARARQGDPDADNRRRQATLRRELASLEATVVREQQRFTPPERMRAVLEEMLERNRRLRLVGLKTLPLAVLGEGAAAAAGQPKPAAVPADRRVFRHGIELTIAGSYLDLHAYLGELEKLPTQVYWASAELNATDYPVATLRLVMYTLSLDKAWMVV